MIALGSLKNSRDAFVILCHLKPEQLGEVNRSPSRTGWDHQSCESRRVSDVVRSGHHSRLKHWSDPFGLVALDCLLVVWLACVLFLHQSTHVNNVESDPMLCLRIVFVLESE